MDKKSIKQMVAREGLILIVILLLGVAFHFISLWIPDKESGNLFEVNLGGTVYKVTKEEAAGMTSNTPLQEMLGAPPENAPQRTSWPLKEIAHKLSLFFFFFAYPIYWLMRFIKWAVKTLRER